MSADERFVALLVAILTGLGLILGALLWVAKLLWQIRGSWDKTNNELGNAVKSLGQLADRDDQLAQQLQRHLDWHDRGWFHRR